MSAFAREEWSVDLLDQGATLGLARDLAHVVRSGDLLALSGDLGAGKTTLARALIRRLAGDDTLDVPSPTYTLMQSYETPRGPVVHADLYRVNDASELDELGWDEAGADAIVLLEWPDRIGDLLPATRLDVRLELMPDEGPTARRVTLSGHGALAGRLARLRDSHSFLDDAEWGEANRAHIKGDASSRIYERLAKAGRTAILMDAPRRPDGPIIRAGKPYSAIAKLAEDILPFVAVDAGLRRLGLSAPEIYAADLEKGFLLLEDLGSAGVAENGAPVPERYERAVDLLAQLHAMALPTELPVGNELYRIPPYDDEAFLGEVELFADWYVPHVTGAPLPAELHAVFLDRWREAVSVARSCGQGWTLRDFHSPNLIWLNDRPGVAAVGLIDFQDALLGPNAYDLVSLLQDARVDVPEDLEIALLKTYLQTRSQAEPDIDFAAFLSSYAILGAQRATKILGIFIRLAMRDGKPGYLGHIPRLLRYLRRDLEHPALAGLSDLYAAILGQEWRT
jgi:N-acetylmuramate 1-kinase